MADERGGTPLRVEAQRLKGFRDQLPAAMSVRAYVVDTLRRLFELHGFAPLETPALEYAATLEGKYGDEERLIYKFEDQGKRKVGLRYDLTVPLARVVAMHLNEIQFPWKRYQISPVWRGENPQFGKYREFYQCDIDIVGSASPLADAEIVAIFAEAMQELGFPTYRVLINHRQLLAALAHAAGVPAAQYATVFRAVDKLDKIEPKAVITEMVRNGIAEPAASKALELFFSGSGTRTLKDNAAILSSLAELLGDDPLALSAIADLRAIFAALTHMDIDVGRIRVDTTLARGLDYYTGPIFEIKVDEPKIGSLGGGGRYDRLMSLFSGRDLPTTGGSFGLERIIDVIQELGMAKASASPSQALVTVFDASSESKAASLQLAADLRAQGIRAECYLNPGDRLGKQFGYADKLGIPFAIVLGPDELAEGKATVKNLKAPPPNQQTIPLEELPALLKG